jgi:hypothetical protein
MNDMWFSHFPTDEFEFYSAVTVNAAKEISQGIYPCSSFQGIEF